MKKIITIILITVCNTVMAQQFYNRYPSSLNLSVYSEVDVLELGNSVYKIETESNISISFHSTIRIIKSQVDGTIVWIKKFDAGIDSSLVATSIEKTLDNNIIVNGTLANDNSFPPMGVTLIKIDTSGTVLWSVLFPGYLAGYYSKNIIQLPDSSYVIDADPLSFATSAVIKLNKNATSVSSKIFQNTVYPGESITSMLLQNNTVSIAFNHGEFINTDTAFNVLFDKKYKLDPTLPYFTHTVADNGDYIFICDQVAGGVLSGLLRIFRTDSIGNLLWAKHVTMWNSFTVHSQWTLFDVIKGVKVMEDTSLNIVAHLVDEGGVGVAVTFDPNGNYITNKVMKAAQMKLCEDGDFLFAANLDFAGSLGIFAKQKHYSINDCDSILDVQVSNGTDSASAAIPMANSVAIPTSLVNFPINVSNATSIANAYCPTATGINQSVATSKNGLTVYPNPATQKITITSNYTFANFSLSIFNPIGALVYKSVLENEISSIDISNLPNGVYFIEVSSSEINLRTKFLKQ